MSSNALQMYENGAAISVFRQPEEVLAEGQKAAKALMTVMEAKKHKVLFNGERYLEREDWGTVAKFYGCTAKSVETKYVEFGDVRGFEATAVCITHDMREIGRAESLCLSDEDNWGEVAKYEWQDELDDNGKKIWDPTARKGKGGYKGKKVEIGKVRKPLFQLKSMAQTRAEAKVLKSVFGWVVVLAGYRPGVAEEMTGNEERFEDRDEPSGKPPVREPQRASEKKKAEAEVQKEEQKKADEPEKITGEIESMREGKDGAIWVNVDKKLVVFEAKFVDDMLKVGATVAVRAQKRHSAKVGDFYAVLSVLEAPKAPADEVLEGEIVEGATEAPADPPAAGVQDLFDAGQVKSASSLPAGSDKKPGTIGVREAQKLYMVMNNNKDKTGLTETILKAQVLPNLPIPIEHLRDLETGMVDEFRKFLTGELNWREAFEE